jgi:hypothetical protein
MVSFQLYNKWLVAHVVPLYFAIFGHQSLPPMDGGSAVKFLLEEEEAIFLAVFVTSGSLSDRWCKTSILVVHLRKLPVYLGLQWRFSLLKRQCKYNIYTSILHYH